MTLIALTLICQGISAQTQLLTQGQRLVGLDSAVALEIGLYRDIETKLRKYDEVVTKKARTIQLLQDKIELFKLNEEKYERQLTFLSAEIKRKTENSKILQEKIINLLDEEYNKTFLEKIVDSKVLWFSLGVVITGISISGS